MIVHHTPQASPLPILGDYIPACPESIPSTLRPTWQWVEWWISEADRVSIYPGRSPWTADKWAEACGGSLPDGWQVQIARGQHQLEIDRGQVLKRGNSYRYGPWRATLLERSAAVDPAGCYVSVAKVWDCAPFKSGRGLAKAARTMARRMVYLGRPWPEWAEYRRP